MKYKQHFLIALALSFALHLLVITGPAWNLPTLDDVLEANEGPPLEAHLVAHPGPVAKPRPSKPKRAKQPKQPPPEQKVSPDGTPAGASPLPPEPVAEETVGPEEAPAAEAAPEPPPPDLPAVKMTLPAYARITYRVTMGQAGFVIGAAVQELRHDESSYFLTSSAETVGLVRLIKQAGILTVSEGDIVASGLRPRQFRMERTTGKNESAVLDWQAGVVQLASGHQYPLEPGAQDMLSMFAQLALIDIAGDMVSLPVATGKRVERYDFSVLGEETINTPRGLFKTLHLRNRQPDGKEATEIWLGLDDSRLPIKIRHIDRRGDIFDQIAERIDYEETEGKH